MRTLFDVNFLLALLQPDHVHFRMAHDWWDENRTRGWASCPLTQNGFVRIVSQPSYFRPIPLRQAVEEFAERAAETDHVFWPDSISLVDAALIDPGYVLGPNQITDVYLLALAVKNGGRLATFDRGVPLRAVRGAEARHLVMI